jgi:hypothetical protein
LLAASRTADVCDAHVVICARRNEQPIVTSDPEDLAKLDPQNKEYPRKLDEIEGRRRTALRMESEPASFVRLVDTSWSKGGFDHVMLLTTSISNALPCDVRDVTIECTTAGPSGTELNRVRETIYRSFRAGRTTSVGEINMGFIHGQAASASCDVIGVKRG